MERLRPMTDGEIGQLSPDTRRRIAEASSRLDDGSPFVQEMGHRSTSMGTALYIKIRRRDDKPMSWTEVWRAFESSYPDKWACQFFPPKDELVDEANIYHLFVLEETPTGVNIRRTS